MRLYLVQHAKAAAKEADPERPVTDTGRAELEKTATFVKKLGLGVDYLWHSGKKRAEQTAEVLADVVSVKKACSARDGLGPNDDVSVLIDELSGSEGNVMIVGHLPFLGKLASLLVAGSQEADIVAFRNAGIVCLIFSDENGWQVDWIVTPELLA
jgi:phosphohistidine phosphatase